VKINAKQTQCMEEAKMTYTIIKTDTGCLIYKLNKNTKNET